jgi:hypothetical protein
MTVDNANAVCKGVASKVTEDNIFDAERRMKIAEKIVGAMTEEERGSPDMVVATVRSSSSCEYLPGNVAFCRRREARRRTLPRRTHGGRG